MKLDHELIRDTLLAIESSQRVSGPTEEELLAAIAKYGHFNRDEVAYTIDKLHEANFVTGKIKWGSDKPVWIIPGNLTFEGHKFLDNIRDDGVWKDTKKVLSKFSSVSLSLISNVASGVITQLIKNQVGR